MSQTRDDHLKRARRAKRESKYLDFKEAFDPSSEGEWCELLKDLIAMANSGGGVLVIGVKNNGKPSGGPIQPVLELDLAVIGDKVFKYTGQHFTAVQINEIKRGSKKAAAVVIGGVPVPLVFEKAGTYEVITPAGKQKAKVAFQQGVVYVRHGAKSEPATTSDLVEVVDRRVDELREQWLGGIRKVIEAPADTDVAVYRPSEVDELGRPTKVRLTTEPGAPTFGMVDHDQLHPYRQTELIKEVNRRLRAGESVNTYDVLSVRHAHQINPTQTPEFAYQPKFGSVQFSDAFADWLIEQLDKDPGFFRRARDRYYNLKHGS